MEIPDQYNNKIRQ